MNVHTSPIVYQESWLNQSGLVNCDTYMTTVYIGHTILVFTVLLIGPILGHDNVCDVTLNAGVHKPIGFSIANRALRSWHISEKLNTLSIAYSGHVREIYARHVLFKKEIYKKYFYWYLRVKLE